jgi:DNA-binding CsgD family transcriptional regulator
MAQKSLKVALEKALRAALDEVLVVAELQPALELVRAATESDAVGFYRFPRSFVGALGQRVLADHQGVDALIVPLDATPIGERKSAGIVLERAAPYGPSERAIVDACLEAFVAAHKRVLRFEALMGHNNGLTVLIEQRLGACAALATAGGEIVWMSRSARDVLGDDGVELLKKRIAGRGEQTEFQLDVGKAHKVFCSLSFVRETPRASVHYIAVELRGSDVAADATFSLTPAEREVYDLLKQGKRYEEIASARFVSLETVRTHVKKVFKKLGIASRKELLDKVNAPR